MTHRSVTFRLVLMIVLLEAATIAALALGVHYESTKFMEREFNTTLTSRAETIASLVDSGHNGEPAMETPRQPLNRRPLTSQHPDLFRVWTDTGHVLDESPQLAQATPETWIGQVAQPSGDSPVFFNTRFNDRPYRAIWAKFAIPPDDDANAAEGRARYCYVVVALSSRHLRDAAEDEVDVLVWSSCGMMALTALVTIGLVRWAMRPIRRTARDIEAINPDNLDRRPVGTADPPEEIRPFVQAINQMLTRLGQAFRQERSFTSNASHELRTPMAVIKSTAQTALRQPLSPQEYRQTLVEVLEDLGRMEHLVDQLLLLARLDEQADRTPEAAVDLAAHLADGAERHQAAARSAGVQVVCNAPAPVVVRGQPDLLDRLFDNLLSNAIRYNRPGGEVRIDLRQADGEAVVEVADTGPGIPPQALEQVFERFFRVDASRSRNGHTQEPGGTGLGLAIAREIVHRHGGRIEAANRPDGGALFRVRLPLDGPGLDPAV